MMNEDRKMKSWLVNTQKSRKELCTNQKVFKAMRKDSGPLESKTVDAVSWPVSRKKSSEINKLSEKNVELDLDYSAPRTHPPHNN